MAGNIRVLVNNQQVDLTDKDYLAQGGQGSIYVKNNAVYKLYHDPAKLIPEQKMQELQALSDLKNVIIPASSVYDGTGQRVGFTMRYVADTEYLCKLFVANFKKQNNITPQRIDEIVRYMQTTLIDIHKRGVIVGDYNEMNFLLDKNLKVPYYIDVDSYQTPSYKCNAIMESVRDRTLPLGDFNEMSDWFSWGIVAFQLYTGIHPYKGKHPSYKMNELAKRMDDGISVFDKDVTVPKFVNMSAIPKSHMEWFKRVFVDGERSIPPFSDGVKNYSVINAVVVDDTMNVITELVLTFASDILDTVFYNGQYRTITRDGLFFEDKLQYQFTKNYISARLVHTQGGDPIVIAMVDRHNIEVFDINGDLITELNDVKDAKVFNDCIYVVTDSGYITQYSFEKLGKIKCLPRNVMTVNAKTSRMYDGVAIHNIFGKHSALIPYEKSKCVTVPMPALDNKRVMDAKRIGRWLFVLTEHKGEYDLVTTYFDESFLKKIDTKTEQDVSFRNLNVTIAPNDMVIFNKDDDSLELFFDTKRGTKRVENTPLRNDLRLVYGKTPCFVDGKSLYSIKTK